MARQCFADFARRRVGCGFGQGGHSGKFESAIEDGERCKSGGSGHICEHLSGIAPAAIFGQSQLPFARITDPGAHPGDHKDGEQCNESTRPKADVDQKCDDGSCERT